MDLDNLFEAICSGLTIFEIKTSFVKSGAKQKRARLVGRETIFMARKSDQADYKRYLMYRQQLNNIKQRMKTKLGNKAKSRTMKVLR